jgi:hypothetical protein
MVAATADEFPRDIASVSVVFAGSGLVLNGLDSTALA